MGQTERGGEEGNAAARGVQPGFFTPLENAASAVAKLVRVSDTTTIDVPNAHEFGYQSELSRIRLRCE